MLILSVSTRSIALRTLRALCLALGLAQSAAVLAAGGQGPVVSAARVEEAGQGAKLHFEVSGPAQAVAYVMAGPDRVIVDLPEVNFQLPPRTGQPESAAKGKTRKPAPARIVASFRFGLFAPGKSRIVIDLGRPALVQKVATVAKPDGSIELQIDLRETDAAGFATAAKAVASEALARELMADAPAQPATGSADAQRPMVVIDPGHGGIDTGALGKRSVIEKDVVFEFSRELKSILEKSGRYRVTMTRSSDVFVPLANRVKLARDSGADLFISIHADTISDTSGVSGATVYTVADRASDTQAAKLAEKENRADAAAGIEGADDSSDVSDILFDLTRRETRTYSHAFARMLVNHWGEAGRLNKNPHRSAGFRVLRAPDVPSVLLELGYLSNEKDSAALLKSEWRTQAATAMLRAVDGFFQPRLGGPREAGRPN
ncbi:MAG: N-acetylmuramoyl-L-alanine amidase [Hyphomicrobiales bacterium]|nr:N-acetylmuramoyl-L-alanine amidase [Hyphomicrobiales bacterium]